MPSPETNRRLTSMGLFLLPLIGVKAASGLMGGGPAPSAATAAPAAAIDPAAAPGSAPVAKVEWSPQQRAAGEYVRHLASTTFGPAPMLYTAAPEKPVVQTVPDEPAPPIATEPEIPAFALQAVMTASGGDKALINGRMYLVGQTVAGTDWIVREINADERSVKLSEANGTRSVTIAVQRPND